MLNDQQERRKKGKSKEKKKKGREGGRNEIALTTKTAIICAPWWPISPLQQTQPRRPQVMDIDGGTWETQGHG